MSSMYAVKLSTGENVPYNTLEEVVAIVEQAKKGWDNNEIIEIHESEHCGTAFVFARHIMGYVVIEGSSLEEIVAQETEFATDEFTYSTLDAIGKIS